MLDMLVLGVEFTSGQFSSSESSGFIEVVVRIIEEHPVILLL